MEKNKITAIVLAAVAFVAFYWGFMSFDAGTPMITLFAFVVVLGSTCAALFVGNAGER